MNRKLVCSIFLVTMFIGVLGVITKVCRVEAGPGTIYIRADGSIEGTANITSADNVTYIFTSNIYDEIIVERNDIVVDGARYTLQGTGSGEGIFLSGRSNVTIKRIKIREFYLGILLDSSSNNNMTGNVIENNQHGIYIRNSSKNNMISRNKLRLNGAGVYVYHSSKTTISANNITNNNDGVDLTYSSDNTLYGCIIRNNTHRGIQLYVSSNNTILENRLRENGLILDYSSNNTVAGNHIANSWLGVSLHDSTNTLMQNNSLDGNQYGFAVYGSELSHYLLSIDTSNLVDGKPVYYLINQHNLTINPLTHPDVGFLALINSTDVSVEGITLSQNRQGLIVAYTNNTRIENNNITNNSGDNILLLHSYNNTICENTITKGEGGIYLTYSSNNKIQRNSITSNYDSAIILYSSSRNIIFGNNIANTMYGGIYLDESSDNSFYHNNFVNNTNDVDSEDSVNVWNNGFEGNYWDNYTGSDLNHDGIGDANHTIAANNTDKYPLMGPFNSFDTAIGKNVNIISNSTVESFQGEPTGTIRFHVSSTTENQTYGFCRVTIPHDVLSPPYNVTINDGLTEVLHFNATLHENGTHTWIYLAYQHSRLEIIIVPEFPSLLVLPLFMMITLLTVIFYRRKHALKA